jgi:hypothetical protein
MAQKSNAMSARICVSAEYLQLLARESRNPGADVHVREARKITDENNSSWRGGIGSALLLFV